MKSNLKQIRKEAGLSQRQLAKKADVAPSQICQLEKDGCNPTLLSACKISAVLNMRPHDIWSNDA